MDVGLSEIHQEDPITRGVIGLTLGVAAIGAEALVMSPVLEDIGTSLGISPGKVGIAVAAYGFALAIISPLVGLI